MNSNENPTIPADDDLKGWKDVETRLGQRINTYLSRKEYANPTVFSLFLKTNDSQYFYDEYYPLSIYVTFVNWMIHEYRPPKLPSRKKVKDKNRLKFRAAKRGKTIVEKMLESDLPDDERVFLEKDQQTLPSFYKIISVNPEQSLIEVEDILTGSQYTFTDYSLSKCIQPNMCLVGKLVPVGSFYFYVYLGPSFDCIYIGNAIQWLEENLDVDIAEDGMKDVFPHIGLLWQWFDEFAVEPMPEMYNRDGDKMKIITALFTVDDEEILEQAFIQRNDVDQTDLEDEYIWFRLEKDGSGLDNEDFHVMLGLFEITPGELFLEVNSRERLEKATEWLEQIPGVRFSEILDEEVPDEEEFDFDEEELDKIEQHLKDVTDEEKIKFLKEYFHTLYMKWLDEPIPMFEDKTPREMCRTKKGKTKVAQMIRSIPTPVDTPEHFIPREEMFRELGIEK